MRSIESQNHNESSILLTKPEGSETFVIQFSFAPNNTTAPSSSFSLDVRGWDASFPLITITQSSYIFALVASISWVPFSHSFISHLIFCSHFPRFYDCIDEYSRFFKISYLSVHAYPWGMSYGFLFLFLFFQFLATMWGPGAYYSA